MKQTERERVYLVKYLPNNLNQFKPIEIQVGDFFDSNAIDALKIRQKGNDYHLIKKEANSAQERVEHVIHIKEGEFKTLIGSTVQSHKKLRYLFPLNNLICELDIYKDKLSGYVRAEVEFDSEEEMNNFIPPEWFAEEITNINHEIHENLGTVTFDEMKERYRLRGIILDKVLLVNK
jgi:CYTH domain-containing protein